MSTKVTFRFYGELNDFLPPERRHKCFPHPLGGRASVKDSIEAIGIPHTEVDLILANGVSVDFAYILKDGDDISVYPVFEAIDISPILRVRPEPLRQTRFVLDTHLGRLARYLRMLGFDTRYQNDFEDQDLAEISSRERRILLTRDRGLLKRSQVTHGYCVRETRPKHQVVEVVRRFDLVGSIQPFARCIRCNGTMEPVDKDQVRDKLPPNTSQYYRAFQRCTKCGQIYWKGSHFKRMRRFIDAILDEPPGQDPTFDMSNPT
jgi:uncharacterized protein with PIN domain